VVLGHGGTPGLIAEITPLVLLVIGAIVVWRRSRDEESDAAWADDEPRVEEDGSDAE
jgi:hypothetical protein